MTDTPQCTYPTVYRHRRLPIEIGLAVIGSTRTHTCLGYCLIDDGQVIFENTDLMISTHLDPLDKCALLALVTFLTARSWDVDPSSFANYTPAQLAWIKSERCDYLHDTADSFESHNHAEWVLLRLEGQPVQTFRLTAVVTQTVRETYLIQAVSADHARHLFDTGYPLPEDCNDLLDRQIEVTDLVEAYANS